MKKLFCVLALLLVLPRAGAVSARGAVVIDADTGETLFEQNADSRLPMASTTKIMTALVALGEGDLDRVYIVKPEYAAVEGSSMYLKAGETLSLRDTLYGLMLASGNDAAVAIAGECGGMTAFVGKMNAKAAELGLMDTHFDNPNGLPSDTHYTTAHELAKITAAALKDPVFRQIVSTKSCTVSGHALSNHNRLLSMYDGAIGVKTGYTRAAGRCLVSAAERNGRTIIAVTLNDPNDWNDHMEMLDAGFAQYSDFGKLKRSLVGKEENLVINPFGFFTGKTFVLVIETAGLQGIEQDCRTDKQFFAIDRFHDAGVIRPAVELNLSCFHIVVFILMVHFFRVH